MKSKKLEFAIVFTFLIFFASCPNALAKEVTKECKYFMNYELAGQKTDSTVRIYDDGSARGTVTCLNRNGYDNQNDVEIHNWNEKKDEVTNSGRCPDYALVSKSGKKLIITISNDRNELDDMVKKWKMKQLDYAIATSTEKDVPDETKESYYKTLETFKEDIKSRIEKLSSDECQNKDGNITKYTECDELAMALQTSINSSLSQADGYIKSGYIDENDDRTKDFKDTLNSANDQLAKFKEEVEEAKRKDAEPKYDDYKGDSVSGCDGLLGTKFKAFLQDAFDLIQVIGPVLALILSMVDLLKASASGEDDAKKKAFKSAGNRTVAAVLLYLVPAILTLFLNLVDNVKGSTCGIS